MNILQNLMQQKSTPSEDLNPLLSQRDALQQAQSEEEAIYDQNLQELDQAEFSLYLNKLAREDPESLIGMLDEESMDNFIALLLNSN